MVDAQIKSTKEIETLKLNIIDKVGKGDLESWGL